MSSVKLSMPLLCAAPIAWYQKAFESQHLILNDYEVFPEHSLMNRIEIATAQGKSIISLPLEKESRKGTYSEVLLNYSNNWHHQLINALKTAYGKSPFFEYYDYQIEALIRAQHETLWGFNLSIFEWTVQALKWQVETEIKLQGGRLEKIEIEEGVQLEYHQVFEDKLGFIANLSILDLIFNKGMDAGQYLLKK